MEKLRCVVERITYHNPENGYTVLKASVKGAGEPVTIVGNLLDIYAGSVLLVEGNWRVDARFGRQFMAERWEETLPATVYGIEKYLGSGLIKGIGPKFAQRIVDTFGTDTIEIIDKTPERLSEINGIGKRRIQQIQKSWEQQREIKNVMLFLQEHGVTTSYAAKIYRQYGNDSIQTVKENPYRLADDIWGIGFKTADRIAGGLGFEKGDPLRCRSGILYTLSKLSEEGHVFAYRDQLLAKAVELLEADSDSLARVLASMLEEQLLRSDADAIYLPAFYYAEIGVASGLRRIGAAFAAADLPKGIELDIAQLESSVSMHYDEIQAKSIRQAFDSKIMILTGGPGTGKTTTTQGLIAAFRRYGLRILLAAPTGRAAKRLSEATRMEAKTIHRLLEYKPPEGYQKNESNPLQGDVLIVDECSMIDLTLMNALLRAVPSEMRLILVGDTNQLPSVGAGNVLQDIIASGEYSVVKLTRIFRQAQTSRIIMNAHKINEGHSPDVSNGKNTDFFFIQNDSPESSAEEIVSLVRDRLPLFSNTPASDIQVLTPMQRGVLGAASLNQVLQEALNPGTNGLHRGAVCFRQNDKVMQIRNNYDKNVFNGDIGQIVSVDYNERMLTVCFDERTVEYDVTELDELVLAYATTIHKAQGSEYPVVVMPISMSHYVMLQRNLIYTGITRAKKLLVLIGTKKALQYAVRHITVTDRNSMLKQRLCGEVFTDPIKSDIMDLHQEFDRVSHVLKKLSGSAFRNRFILHEKELEYIEAKGYDTIERHARELIKTRLAPSNIPNDGKQTPMQGHPVFIAQHATATCCRGCLSKWYGIPTDRILTPDEQDYITDVIMEWIGRQVLAF